MNYQIFDDENGYTVDDEKEYEEISDGLNQGVTKRKIKIAWVFEKQIECQAYVESEICSKWTIYKQYDAYGGKKIFYKCKFSGCPSKIQLFFFKNPTAISMFSNHIEQQCIAKNKKKLSR